MYRALWHSDLHLAPEQVDRLTPAELALALDPPDPEGKELPRGATPLGSLQDLQAYAERRRRLTPRERLQEARE